MLPLLEVLDDAGLTKVAFDCGFATAERKRVWYRSIGVDIAIERKRRKLDVTGLALRSAQPDKDIAPREHAVASRALE